MGAFSRRLRYFWRVGGPSVNVFAALEAESAVLHQIRCILPVSPQSFRLRIPRPDLRRKQPPQYRVLLTVVPFVENPEDTREDPLRISGIFGGYRAGCAPVIVAADVRRFGARNSRKGAAAVFCAEGNLAKSGEVE